MKKIILTLIVTMAFENVSKAQFLNFANQIGNSSDDRGYGVAADMSGNSYISGAFSNTVDFDPSGSILNLTSNGATDAYFAKYNPSGGVLWAKSIGGLGIDQAGTIALDANGDVYFGGIFNGTVDFNPGSGVFNLTSSGNEDGFILKLDNLGNFIWAIKIGGTLSDALSTISIDNQNNLVISGDFKGTADFDPTSSVQNLVSNGGTDSYFAKYNLNGQFIWVKQIGNLTNDERIETSIDDEGNIYTSGYFQGTIDMDPSLGTFNLTSVGGEDIYIGKYSKNGFLIWAKSIGGSQGQRQIRMLNDNNGYFYVTGIFNGTCDFDPSSSTSLLTSNGGIDAFIAKYDTLGNYVWALSYGGTGTDQGYGLSIDGSGNIYGTGMFQNTVDFDPSSNTYYLTSNGSSDIYINKFSSSGQFLSAKGIGGVGEDFGWNMVYKNGNLFYTGTFSNSVDFDPNLPIYNLTSIGSYDGYLLKITSSDCTTTIFDTITTHLTVYDTTYIKVTDTLLISTLVGINPPNNSNTIKVFPNPANTHITIDYGNFTIMNGYRLKIQNSFGQELFQTNITQQTDYLSLSNWGGNGMYFVHIIDTQGSTIDIKKIVLQ